MHCDQYTQKQAKIYVCRFSSLWLEWYIFFKAVQNDRFLHFLSGFLKLSKQPKISHFVDFDWENALKWLEWCIFRVQGMPNPMAQVSSLYDKWFLKNQNFRQKFHILLILTGKMHWNGLSGAYLGFKACLNPMAQVSSLYDKWFLKNQNFRRQVA